MKNIFSLLILLFPGLAGLCQETGYTVFGTATNPYSSGTYALLTLDTLQNAETLKDIYAKYHSDWVASYIGVEVASDCRGIVRKAAGKNDTLTEKQLDILRMAEAGCRVDVEIDYIPQNSLRDNPPRKYRFSLTPIPIMEAKYPGGANPLRAYLQQNIIEKIPKTLVAEITLAKARFKISETGQVSDVHIYKTSDDDSTDKLILEAICSMPAWRPAQNSKGMNIAQEFEFSMGTSLLLCPYPN